MKINYKSLVKIEFLIVLVLIGITIYSITYRNPVIKNAITLATTHKSEPFTELSFANSSNLPKTVKNNEIYHFAFNVYNAEAQDLDYSYIVYLQSDYQKVILDKGTFKLKNDESKSINEDFGPLKAIKMEVVVELINKNQQIDFWMKPF